MKPNKTTLILGLCALFLLLTAIVLAFLLLNSLEEEKGLREAVELLEADFSEEIRRKQREGDSLQGELKQQEARIIAVRRELKTLQEQKKELKTDYDEEKTALSGIRTADSLRDAIAGRYRKRTTEHR